MTARAERLRLQAMATALGLHIGKRIRMAREETGLETQQALADKLPSPINNQYVSKWEGGVKPKDATLKLIADALGKDVGWFYEGFARNGPTPEPFVADEAARAEAELDDLRQSIKQIDSKLDEVLRKLADQPDIKKEVHRAFEDYANRLGERIGKRPPLSRRNQDPPAEEPPAAA